MTGGQWGSLSRLEFQTYGNVRLVADEADAQPNKERNASAENQLGLRESEYTRDC